MTNTTLIETEILRLTAACKPGGSISPSDVAQAVQADWQPLLTAVRRAAIRLMEQGSIDILRKGRPVPAADVRGVIRLRTRPDVATPDVAAPDLAAPEPA